MPRTTIRLPYGIVIERVSRVGTCLSSEMRDEFVDPSKEFDSHGEVAAHAVEALLVALVAEGVEMDPSAAGRALNSAAETIAEYLVRLDD
ncbi:hypothetical protein ACVNIS_18065 [Sphaerotilaceae bacterium SBD11-9]